jgi:hypothetical protein
MPKSKDPEKIKADMASVALPVLIERLGGSVVITEEEYEAMGRRYGGVSRLAVQAEYHGNALHLTLIKNPKPPLS